MFKLISNEKVNIKILEISIVFIIILIGAGLRLVPHPPNFAPVTAVALFSGVYFTRRKALLLPILAMVISDIFIGYYELGLMIAVYGSFLLFVILGFWLKNHKKWYTVLGSSFLAAVIFFLLTNFAVWIFTPWYAKTIPGILQCYLMALPFFRNTLLGNLFYVPLFFGTFELVKILIRKKIASTDKVYGHTAGKSSLV